MFDDIDNYIIDLQVLLVILDKHTKKQTIHTTQKHKITILIQQIRINKLLRILLISPPQ